MRSIIYAIGYVCTALLGVYALANADPEPLGATVTLSFLAAVGAVASSIAYTFSVARLHRSPSKFAALLAGAFCAGAFFAVLSLMHLGVNQEPLIVGGLLSALLIAFVAPICSAA